MNHNEFIGFRTVMFSVLCIYGNHWNFKNPMFTMVSYVLFSVWKPSPQSIDWINKSFRSNSLQPFSELWECEEFSIKRWFDAELLWTSSVLILILVHWMSFNLKALSIVCSFNSALGLSTFGRCNAKFYSEILAWHFRAWPIKLFS